MKKRWLALGFIGVMLLAATSVMAAPDKTMWEFRKANTEMRKNVTWMMEGMLKLSQSSDKRLVLMAAEKKKILPIVQAMVDRKIIILKAEDHFGGHQNQGNGQSQNRPDPNDPAVKARIREMQDQTDYGNKQADQIDLLLTSSQKRFIDNLDFNAEQYGYLDFSKLFGSQAGGQWQRPDPQKMQQIRDQMHAGMERQAELNRKVLAMLQGKK